MAKQKSLRIKSLYDLTNSGWHRNQRSGINALYSDFIIPNKKVTISRTRHVKYHGGGFSEDMLFFIGKKVNIISHRYSGKHLIFNLNLPGRFQFTHTPVSGSIELHSSAFNDEDVKWYLEQYFYLETTQHKQQKRVLVSKNSFKSFNIGHMKVTANHMKQMIKWLQFQGILNGN